MSALMYKPQAGVVSLSSQVAEKIPRELQEPVLYLLSALPLTCEILGQVLNCVGLAFVVVYTNSTYPVIGGENE